jgi:UDPglucose 6-dehydrogenase
MVKYACNCFFSVKVALNNEFYDICNALGINYDRVKRMMLGDGRIGNSHMDVPGHDKKRGFGGSCFPKDLNGLICKSEELGINPIMMKAAWEKNLEVRYGKKRKKL